MPSFSAESIRQLETCDPRLQRLFSEVIKYWDCTVLQGKRTESEEAQHLADGTSHTNHSKHVYPLGAPSLAVDVTPYPIKWGDKNRMYAFGGFVVGTAVQLGLNIRWGGDWDSDRDFTDQTFNDLPHFEIRE